MLQQTLAVFLVLGLLLVTFWLLRRQGLATLVDSLPGLKRLGGRPTSKQICMIEKLALTPQHSLHLVSIEDRMFLFATSPSGCQPVELELPLATQTDDPLKIGTSC
jgi:flagellar biogenesis protein FliO